MSDRKWRTWEVLGLIFVLAAGNLLHFVYDWSGQSPVVGALASVNESTWEHMKLLTTPWVLWSIAELIALRRTGLPVLTARAAGLLAGLAAIPLLFYGYQGVLGRDIMWLDVAIFQIAVLLGFWVTWPCCAAGPWRPRCGRWPGRRCWRRYGRRLSYGPSPRRTCRCSRTRRRACGGSDRVLFPRPGA